MKIRKTALKPTVILATIATLSVLATAVFAQAPSGMTLAWSDEFNGTIGAAPNSGTWAYDTGAGGWGNGELQTYVTSLANCHIISDGTGTDSKALQIEPQTDSSHRWYSARIKTQGKKSFGPYGYYEARCKFPTGGQGYWPAFWMLGTNITTVSWPKCGEIDIAEEVNSQSNNHGSLHAPNWNPSTTTSVSSATTTYHNYGANWQSTGVTFYVDGRSYATFSKTSAPSGGWVFTSTDFILLNCAIGGSFPGNPTSSTQPNANFDIDYVRQYH